MFNLFGSDSKNVVIDFLTKNPNQSAKEIENSINKYSKQLTYKNVFRILTELTEQGIVTKKDSKYYLKTEFIEYMKNFTDNMLHNYTNEMFVKNKTDFYNVMLYLDPNGKVKSEVSDYLNTWLMDKLDDWYSKYYDPSGIEVDKILSSITSKFGNRKDLNILEVGCGTGRVTKELSKRYRKVTAIDINERYINFCKNKFTGIKFQTSDILDFKSKDKFDVIIFSWIGLHYHPNISEVLENLKKLTNTENLILILDAYYQTEFVEILNMLRPIDMNKVKLTKETLNEKIISFFGNLKSEVVLNNYEFDSVESLINNFKIELTLEESRVWTKEDEEKIKEYLLGKKEKLKIGEGFWLSIVEN
jgi:SAM-dependent methyltransferase